MGLNSRSGMPSTIYMSYDGMLEPLGQSQVIAYLTPLAKDFAIHLFSFEKPKDSERGEDMARLRAQLEQAGITWHPQRYHKRPKVVSTIYDMLRAAIMAAVVARRYKARVFHARSLLSAVMLLPALAIARGRLIFDIRGFWTDERVEGGIIKTGSPIERTLRWLEQAVFRRADHIVTLTHASVDRLREDPRFGHPTAPITVIPTCADLDLFTPGPKDNEPVAVGAGMAAPFVVGYVGQIGAWYRFDEMIELYKAFERRLPGARMLIINRSQQDEVRQALRAAGVAENRYEVAAAGRADVARQVRRMDVGVVLMIDAFSNFARAPTKLAEYLGCGVPCVGDPQVGDLHMILDGERVGMTMADHSPAERERAVDAILSLRTDPALSERCVESAHRHFSLADGVVRYRGIYRTLLGDSA